MKVRRAREERANLTRLQRREIGLATMLMVVVFVFFVCNLLALVVNILEVMSITVNELNTTSNLLVTFNSSVNLVIYCIFGERFKRIFFNIFCPACLQSSSEGGHLRYPQQQQYQRGRPRPLLSRQRQPLITNGGHDRGEGIEDTYEDMNDIGSKNSPTDRTMTPNLQG